MIFVRIHQKTIKTTFYITKTLFPTQSYTNGWSAGEFQFELLTCHSSVFSQHVGGIFLMTFAHKVTRFVVSSFSSYE